MLSRHRITAALVAAVCALTIASGARSQAPSSASSLSAQPERPARFLEIEDENGFLGFFNLAQGTVRFLAVISPTSPDCQAAFDEIHRIMEAIPSKRLRAYIVYQPTREGDTRESAVALAAKLNESRAVHFWDPNHAIARLLASASDTDDATQNRCYLFPTNAMLTVPPPAPALAMDPQSHDGPALFDGAALEAAVREQLTRFEAEHGRSQNRDDESP